MSSSKHEGVSILLRLPPALHRKVVQQSAETGRSIQELLLDGLSQAFSVKGRRGAETASERDALREENERLRSRVKQLLIEKKQEQSVPLPRTFTELPREQPRRAGVVAVSADAFGLSEAPQVLREVPRLPRLVSAEEQDVVMQRAQRRLEQLREQRAKNPKPQDSKTSQEEEGTLQRLRELEAQVPVVVTEILTRKKSLQSLRQERRDLVARGRALGVAYEEVE
jgi:hypothetical protein